MDVTCERCGTEYEFDETLLSGRGTSVKCTNCGHVFKVYPKARGDVDRTTSNWRIQRGDGSVDTIDTLRELQRRISSGELSPSDEISRGSEDWKPLGSIPELETFFQAAGVSLPDRAAPSPIPPVPPADTSSDSSLPPGRKPRQPTLLGVVPVPPATRAAAVTATGPEAVTAPMTAAEAAAVLETEPGAGTASEGVTEPRHAPPPASASTTGPLPEIEDADFEERPPPSSVRRSTPPPAYYDDDEDIPELPGRGWSPTRWLLVVVAVGVLALLATQWQRVAGILGLGSDPALVAEFIEDGDAALAEEHLAGYERAIEAYGRAVQAEIDEDPDLMARLSTAHALAAQAMLDDASPSPDEAVVEGHARSALSNAEQALMVEPGHLQARFAEADALRLGGDVERAREALERARLIPFSRTAEFFRIDARLTAAENDGELQAGLLAARQAVESDPEGIRYRLLLARAEQAAGNTDRARAQLDVVLQADPDHPAAMELLQGLEALEVEVDAGVGADGGAEATAEAETAAASETEAAPETAPDAGAAPEAGAASEAAPETAPAPKAGAKARDERPPARRARAAKSPTYDEYDRLAEAAGSDAFVDGRPPLRDYGWYMREGRAALAGGNHDRARAFFESALEASPGSADATDALGQVAFAKGDYALALRYFRSAAQRGHPDGYFNLGRAYERLGRNEEAVSAYYTYLKRHPSGTHAAAAKNAIKTLEPRVKLPTEDQSESPGDPGPTGEAPTKPAVEPEPEGASEPPPGSEATPP